MAIFEYTGLDASGKKIRGTINADSLRSARTQLKQKSVFPTTLKESATSSERKAVGNISFFRTPRIGVAILGVATRQLATLVEAGIPLVEALSALVDQLDIPYLREVFSEVRDRVNEGESMADAMRSYPKVFPKLYINMIASGEISGSLDLVLVRLADLLEAQSELRQKILSASTYPILMLVLCVGVILILLAYVVPQITEIFADQKATLPLPTQIVVNLSNLAQKYWLLVLIAIGLLVAGFRYYASTTLGRKKVDQLKLRLPLIGPLTIKVATSRFARTLSTLLGSGVQLLTALDIVKNIVGNTVLEETVAEALEGVREGGALAAELSRRKAFPTMLIHMIAIGERTGQLEPMLNRAAHAYELEVNTFLSRFTRILEPILILVLAVVVGGILASVMLPMLEMSALAGGM